MTTAATDTAPPPVVTVRGVTKEFHPPPAPWRRLLGRPPLEPVVALSDVDLEIRAGEVLGLVGPNGAGKTVLMKLIATLSEPTRGSVSVFGSDIAANDVRAIRRRIGMATTDERSFYWRLTCRQNLTFFARLYGHDRRTVARRTEELLDVFDIRPLGDRAYRVLSAGNRQRLAIARALLPDPDLLLLDEPTSSMDPIAAANLRRLIRERLQDDRRAILYTTHNLTEVEQLCDRVAVLHGGRLLTCTDLARLFAQFGPAETVTVRCRKPLQNGLVDRLGPRVPGLETTDNGPADACDLSFHRETDDDALDRVLAELVRSGATILGCETRRRRFEEVFEQLLPPRPGNSDA